VEVSDFETWEPAGQPSQFDLVCSAQAWHWVDPGVRLHKAHRLLRPGGWLALWWNRAAGNGSPLRRAFDDVYRAIAPSLPTGGIASKGGPPPPDEDASGLSFGKRVRRSYSWSHDYTADEWVALLRTQSDHRLLPPAQLDRLTWEIRRLVQEHGNLYRHEHVCRLWAVEKL
jgi:SAM-dependent methyltransferase